MSFFGPTTNDLDVILATNTTGVHNLSKGSLLTYFQLGEEMRRGNVQVIPGAIAIGGKVKRIFQFNANFQPTPAFSGWKVYSAVHVPGASKFEEMVYPFDKVFDPASYDGAKKRYQRLTQPEKLAEKWELHVTDNYAQVKLHAHDIRLLHDEWVQKKLENPNTYRMMFPNARYNRCVDIAAEDRDLFRVYLGLIYPTPDSYKLLGVRVVSIENGVAYDLACFTRFWDAPSQFSEVFNFLTLCWMNGAGAERLNCGASLNKQLKGYKSHYPFESLISYSYSIK